MKSFKFEMEQRVKMSESAESGVVIGRAEYAHAENEYRVRYLAGDGRQVECWWSESSLEVA
ncbi:hypothetical protein TH9_12310 [Thalassospira xiamenensis]|uniref:hypothetical protein n=1 Tax=Thalassospira xiamenensis TaxID=220697 RepID=UPI000DED939A|nr:hypothetical protein [Thalassospira xiamenensis]RCK32505.1 hypothetical protein TH9_12310 [Thalassospira xiamenensis]